MRFFASPRHPVDERLLWSRDTRFAHRLASVVPGCRVLELDSRATRRAACRRSFSIDRGKAGSIAGRTSR